MYRNIFNNNIADINMEELPEIETTNLNYYKVKDYESESDEEIIFDINNANVNNDILDKNVINSNMDSINIESENLMI